MTKKAQVGLKPIVRWIMLALLLVFALWLIFGIFFSDAQAAVRGIFG